MSNIQRMTLVVYHGDSIFFGDAPSFVQVTNPSVGHGDEALFHRSYALPPRFYVMRAFKLPPRKICP